MNPSKTRSLKSVEAVIADIGPSARHKELLSRGINPGQISKAVAQGRIVRLARGHYALPGATARDEFLARHQATLTCLSAAVDLGLWLLVEPNKPHVAVAHGRPVPGCVVHKMPGRPTLLNVLKHCVKCSTELEALIVLESAVVKRECSIKTLRELFPGRKDCAGRAIVDMIDPQSMAITETAARYHLHHAGYNVQGQAHLRDVGHMDLLVEGVLAVETDGEKYHNTPKGWAEDLRRDAMYVINGVWRLRLPASMVLYHPETMLNWVRQALDAIGYAPGSS